MAGNYSAGALTGLDAPASVVDVKDFGAVGDGAHNDYDNVAAAIAHAQFLYDQTIRSGGSWATYPDQPTTPGVINYREYYGPVLYFPPGRYLLTPTGTTPAPLAISRPLLVRGAGYNESILMGSANLAVLKVEPATVVNANTLGNRTRIEDLGFRGSYKYRTANTAVAAQDGLLVVAQQPAESIYRAINTYLDVRRCQFFGLGGSGIRATFTGAPDGDKINIDGCLIYACGRWGINLEKRTSTTLITRCHITNNAGGIGVLGEAVPSQPANPASTVRIVDNIIEANDGGVGGSTVKAGDVNGPKPFIGVYLAHTNFAEISGNYFEWHVNGVYVGDSCRNITVARNWFDGNDVNLPHSLLSASGGAILDHQIACVYVKASAGALNPIGVVIEENDCYVPVRPYSEDDDTQAENVSTWNPPGSTWASTYPVFPMLDGTQHELIRNSAREAGGRRRDADYDAAAVTRVYFESVQAIAQTPSEVRVQHAERAYRKLIDVTELVTQSTTTRINGNSVQLTGSTTPSASGEVRLVAPYARFESPGPDGQYHHYIYPAGSADNTRAHVVLARREGDGTLTTIRDLWYARDIGFTFPPTGFILTSPDSRFLNADTGTAAPTSGSYQQGSIRFNSAPTELVDSYGLKYTLLGWRCVANGTPGTWAELRSYTSVNTATAAPTTGTWATGAIVYNQTPAELGTAGSKYTILGWRCVSGGAPGTWVDMRTLTGS